MNFRCSISISFSALCVLASVTFSSICIYLLFEERKEVGISFLSVSELKVHDKSKYYSILKSNYDLTDEEGVQSFLRKLENYRYQYHKLNMEKLLCVPLNEIEIFRDRDELKLDRLSYDLAEHLNETFHRALREEQRNASEIRKNLKIFDLTVLRFLRSRSYYILHNRLCLVLNYFPFTEFFLEGIYRQNATAHMLIKDSHQVISLKNNTAFNLRLIFNNNNPNLNCSRNSTEFECLSGCFKGGFRLSKYFYNGNETGAIQLSGRSLNESVHKLVADHEAACFRKCGQTRCVISDFQKKNFDDNSSGNSNNMIKVSYFEFSPLISNFSFYVQITGLTLSFFGVSCYGLALKLIANSFDRNKKTIGSVFKVLLWSACLVTFIVLLGESLANYRGKKSNRMAKTSVAYPGQPERISLVVCLPVGTILLNDTKQMTLCELELASNDAFNQTVNELYLEFLNERIEINWKVNEKKVLFNANDYSSELGRCFLIELEADEVEVAYHSIWSQLKLVIVFKNSNSNYELYILPEGQKFNYNSFRFDPAKTAKFNKIIYKSSPLKCVDYRKEYSTCDSRWNCLDECVVNKSTENDLNLPILHVIDKDLFNPIDWSYLKPDYNLKGNPKLEDDCREEISSPDCYKTFFERDPYDGPDSGSDGNKVKIDLYFPILLKTAADDSSGYDVFLDFLNVETIVFDWNLLKVLTTVVFFLKVKVFELHFMTRKLFLWPVYFLCFAGFALHLLFIVDQVQNSRLVFSNFYEELSSQPMPELVFCFQHDRWSLTEVELNSTKELSRNLVDYTNGNLTGIQLEKITNEMRADTVFESISYLSSESGWIQLNLSGVQANETRFQRNEVTLERFYLSNKKCLSIKTGQSYHRGRFYFDDTSDGTYEVMRVNFNRSFLENHLVTFFTRTIDRRFLSDIKFLNYSASPDAPAEHSRTSYTVAQDDFEIINNDKFRLVKNPMLYGAERFSNVGQYMADQMESFSSEYNATTLELPLTEPYFDLPIKDSLFVEYDRLSRKERPSKDRNQPDDGLIYERKVIENRVRKHHYGSDQQDFKFNMKFGKFQQVFRSKENLGKFFLNLLNALSLWSGFGAPFRSFVFKWSSGIVQPSGEMFERS